MEKFDFGNKLYEYRTQKGLTQKELGKLLGVTDKAVSKWETGESKPRLDKMTQITELFETSIDRMLGKETSADGEQLKPYKTIFDLRLEKYGKYYKAGRIWTYIIALMCVAALAFDSVSEMLNGGFAIGKIRTLIGTIILASATVVFTSVFKPRFNECKSKDMNIFMAFIFAVFLLVSASPVFSAVKIGKATGEYDKVTIGLICAEALILAVVSIISSLKKRYIFFVIFILGFSVSNLFKFESDYYLTIFAIVFQFACFIKKRNWLSLAEKAEIEIKRQIKGKKITKIFVTAVIIITVLSIALSSFSPYIIYRICMAKYFPTYKPNTIIDYDYSAKTDEEFTQIEIQGAKLKIPKGYEKISETDGMAFYRNAQNSVISVGYYPAEDYPLYFDEFDIESLEPDEAENIRAERAKEKLFDSLCQKHFGISTDTHYGMKYVIDFVDVRDVKFYETQKAALMCGIYIMKSVADTGTPMSVSSFDDGLHCGIVEGRQMQRSDKTDIYWTADVWYSNNKDGAYYNVVYWDRNSTDITDNQMICKIVNSLEF